MKFNFSREVTFEEASSIKDNQNLSFFMETSAKNGFNTNELFCRIAQILYDEFLEKGNDTKKIDDEILNLMSVKNNKKRGKNRSCCVVF